jgi:hypothetical protein
MVCQRQMVNWLRKNKGFSGFGAVSLTGGQANLTGRQVNLINSRNLPVK